MMVLVIRPLAANETQKTVADQESSQISTGKQILPLPIIGYAPETKLILGGMVLGQFKMPGTTEKDRSSNALVFGNFSFFKHYMFGIEQTLFTGREKWMWTGNLAIARFPDKFWGIGPSTRDDEEVKMDYLVIGLTQNLYRRMGQQLFIGPRLRWEKQYSVRFTDQDDQRVYFDDLNATGDYHILGLGAGLIWDRRNRVLMPTSGFYLGMNGFVHHKNLGSSYSYTLFQIDARTYFTFGEADQQVLAMQFITRQAMGDVPFRDLPLLGGMHILRGYYGGRYRDKHYSAFQSEWRQKVWGPLGVTFFAGAGNVADKPSHFFDTTLKYAAGFGLRYNINEQDPVNVRVDCSFGPGTSGVYITLAEAF